MPIDRPTPELSPREQQLLKYAAEGMTDTAIAHKLGISEATVATYWGRVRIKLGPYSRTELVATMMRSESKAALQELRQANQNLVKELQAQSSSGTTFYRDLLENAPDAMILVTEAGLIEYGNLAAHELFGYDREELNGLDLLALVPLRFQQRHVQHRLEFVRDPARRQMGEHVETPAVTKNAQEFPIRAALSAITTPAGLIVMCVIRPVEQEK